MHAHTVEAAETIECHRDRDCSNLINFYYCEAASQAQQACCVDSQAFSYKQESSEMCHICPPGTDNT